MKELEEKIKEAAHKTRDPQIFYQGAISPEAGKYWYQRMYTEEEVKQLLIKFKAFLWEREDFSTAMATKWLSQNKQK